MPTANADTIEVTETLYGVESFFDLPFIVLGLLLAVVAVAVSKRKTYLLLVGALLCLALKHAAFLLVVEPTPSLIETQRWLGTLGWLLLAVFAGVSVRRQSVVKLAASE